MILNYLLVVNLGVKTLACLVLNDLSPHNFTLNRLLISHDSLVELIGLPSLGFLVHFKLNFESFPSSIHGLLHAVVVSNPVGIIRGQEAIIRNGGHRQVVLSNL